MTTFSRSASAPRGGTLFPPAGSCPKALAVCLGVCLGLAAASRAELPPPAPAPATAAPAAGSSPAAPIYIAEYRVQGARELPTIDVETAVYPFLGPGRTPEDVEGARAALEKAYKDKGYQTVEVQIPQQQVTRGVVVLQVVEGKVGQLRVKGSRYHSLAAIKAQARSMAEGKVINFNEVTRDIVALNQLGDRRITPTLRAGAEPGTVDIDLTVKDTLPLHGSLELNNRYSADTTHLRLNGSLSYANLWQLGHAVGLSFQIAPERPDDAKVFSGYYLARLPGVDWLSLIVQGTKQDSNVSTLGGAAVAGRGEIIGGRAIITLPPLTNFYQSISLGLDYKHFEENVLFGVDETQTPITYYPLSAGYSGTWAKKGSLTELNATLNLHLRGTGDRQGKFDAKRYNADRNFLYLRGDLAHTRDLPGGFEFYAKVQGQLADQPLLNSEQFSGGGLGTVRGFYESQALGDNAIFGTVELRSPSLSGWLGEKLVNEWRFYVFCDAGALSLNDPLPEQEAHFELASAGLGSRFRLLEHVNGSLDAGFPFLNQTSTSAADLLLTFRLSADF